ncbi:hypothetical protein BU26DRAFT_424670 [Trematosphaeria pertusa]|uniref:Uncharacterized protein n=1 Tax=Trematosphaeria pertusa TaxID=390896 RepID=A0A6A6IJ33_9PLEO|nr:uncharacterized protein BU26DRAFT_424670 [Trematosphaeria pertusa]KAF2250386.1 hypothetical protein BU26DRAFT_424670 [Trematosphaeria pertusa]
MMISRRVAVVASSILLIFIVAISLAASVEVRAPPKKLVQISIAQAAKDGQFEKQRAGSSINGTAFDRVDILSGTATVGAGGAATYYLPPTPSMMMEEGMIGQTPTPQPTPSAVDEGYIGPVESPQTPGPTPRPPPSPQFPILALSYAGDGGPKHCRGELVQKLSLPPPASSWKSGTCVDLPADARCGVFFAGKDDNCEAQLFNMAGCYNTTETYVNTVVFMPEERAVGAIWRSMYVRCGVDAPAPALIDPAVLGGLLKKPGGG